MGTRKRIDAEVRPPRALALLGLVVILQTGFQTREALRDRRILDLAMMDQADTLRPLGEERAKLEALVNGTLNLADRGDKNAKAIVDRMDLERFRGAGF